MNQSPHPASSLIARDQVLHHWGLAREPFGEGCPPAAWFAAGTAREARQRLRFFLAQSDLPLMLVTGGSGLGKTALAARVAAEQPSAVAVFHESALREGWRLPATTLLLSLERDELPLPQDACELALRLRNAALRAQAATPRVVLLLDDAHRLTGPDLEGLLELADAVRLAVPGFGLVLIGLPVLGERLAVRAPYDDRVALRATLGPLAGAEVGPYLAHRLAAAGRSEGTVFSARAVAALAYFSHGRPRRLHHLARLALALGATVGSPQVEPDLLRLATLEFFCQDLEPARSAPA